MNNDYYVYIYWRLDINEPFYVGKGRGNRWKRLDEGGRKNKHFQRIINKYPIATEIFIDNITEEQAHGIECWLINELVFKYGYSIDIPNNRSNEKHSNLVNCTWGGEGCSGRELSDEAKEKIKKANLGKRHTEETKKKLSESKKKLYKGEGNPFYGKSHTEETKKKMKKNHKDVKRKNNPFAKSVICFTTKKIFLTIEDAKEHYGIKGDNISSCCKRKRNYCGMYNRQKLKWGYVVWNHNKKYRPKSYKFSNK